MDWFVMTPLVVRCGMTEALKGIRVNLSEAKGTQSGVLLISSLEVVHSTFGQLRRKTALRPSHCRDLGGDSPM